MAPYLRHCRYLAAVMNWLNDSHQAMTPTQTATTCEAMSPAIFRLFNRTKPSPLEPLPDANQVAIRIDDCKLPHSPQLVLENVLARDALARQIR